jgi:hypothetical protein
LSSISVAPFAFSIFILQYGFFVCKCVALLLFKASDAALDLAQDHFGNIARRRAKLRDGVRRIEQRYAVVFVGVEYGGGVDAQAHQHRMGNARHKLQHECGAYLIVAHIGKRAIIRYL